MKGIFAAIIAFFSLIFGGVKAPVTPTPQPIEPAPIESEEIIELKVGDYLDVQKDDSLDATARIIQTNGNKFTVEITVNEAPNTTVVVYESETAHTYKVPDSGILTTTILTNTVEISVSVL